MSLIACTCPHCGGEVKMEDSMISGFCIHCGRQIFNDKAVVGRIDVQMDRSVEVRNMLKLIKYSLYDGDYASAKAMLAGVMRIDADIADVWYIDAVLDRKHAKSDITRAKGLRSLGIFTEEEVGQYRHRNENSFVWAFIPMFFAFFALMATIPISIIFELYWLAPLVLLVGVAVTAVPALILYKSRREIPMPRFDDEEGEAVRAAREHSEKVAASRRR